jgi:Rab family protein
MLDAQHGASTGIEPLPVAVFWDYVCIYHDAPGVMPSRAVAKLHAQGLAACPALFAHAQTTVWLQTCLSPRGPGAQHGALPGTHEGHHEGVYELDTATYLRSGACRVQLALASLYTPPNMVLDLGRLPWSLELRALRDFEREVVGVCSLSSPPAHAFQLRLRPPMLPLRLDRELETARALFTDGAERKAALDGYVRAFEVLVGSVEVLWSPLLGWGDHEAALLAEILPLCPRLRQLQLAGNPITDEGFRVLGPALPFGLEALDVSATGLTDAGAHMLARSLPPGLRSLNLDYLPRLSTAGMLECATRLRPPEVNPTGVMSRLIKLPEQPPRLVAATGAAASDPYGPHPSFLPPMPLPPSQPTAYDHLFMVALLGDAGCGKSCALKRFAEDEWQDEGPTIGVEMRMRSLLVRAKHTVVRLQLWDASGAELGGSGAELGGPSSLDSMCVGVHGVVVMYDAQNRSSFLSVPKWIERAEALAPHNASRLLLGTKYDSEPASADAAAASHRSARGARGAPAPSRATPERVDAREASRLASSHKMLFAAASALEGSGIDEAFAMLAEHLLATREGSDAEAEQRLAEVEQRQRSPLRPLETARRPLETAFETRDRDRDRDRGARERSRSPTTRRVEPGPLSAGSLNGSLNGSLSGSRSPTRSAGSRSGSFGTSRSRTATRPSADAERELQAFLKRCIQCFLPPPPFARPRATSPGRGAMMMVPAQRSTAAAASAAKARARARSPTVRG